MWINLEKKGKKQFFCLPFINNIPILATCCVDDVALAYAFGRACERQINFAPDDLTASSWDFPPLRNTKYTCNKKIEKKST